MIGTRTRGSIAQLLDLFPADLNLVLLRKHGIAADLQYGAMILALNQTLGALHDDHLLRVLDEIVRTKGALRGKVGTKYHFDERWADLTQCLLLDGYALDDKRLLPLDPSIRDAPPLDDDLLIELKTSGAPRADEIIRKINDSTSAFRSVPPDYNASLNNARVALETLAADIAVSRPLPNGLVDSTKWGAMVTHLRMSGLITLEEERGLAGVYTFVSPGSHRPIGLSEEQMARLGRSLAMSMCWFLLKRQLAVPLQT